MVEVDKVLRDLQMLHKTLRTAPFHRLLTDQEETGEDATINGDEDEQQRGSSHEESLQRYRALLNATMRMVVAMNAGAERLARSNEVCRLKLVSSDLRKEIQRLQ